MSVPNATASTVRSAPSGRLAWYVHDRLSPARSSTGNRDGQLTAAATAPTCAITPNTVTRRAPTLKTWIGPSTRWAPSTDPVVRISTGNDTRRASPGGSVIGAGSDTAISQT